MDLQPAVEALTGRPVQQWEPLKSSGRNVVARATLAGLGPVIVKAPKSPNVRERAALQVLDGREAPRLIAAGTDPDLLVLEDLGDGRSLADYLLGDDPAAARTAVLRWAEAIGRLHAATSSLRPDFKAALTALAPEDPPPLDTSVSDATEAAESLAGLLPQFGLTPAPAALAELVALADLGPGPYALTPGDACPDNNVERDGRLRLIDFEWAGFRHVAWDAAYLSVPWPTCWCSWRLPDEVTAEALEVLALPVPAAVISQATAAWALITAAGQLPRAIDDDHAHPRPARPMPDRRPVIQHRLAVAARHTPPGSDLHRLAGDALAATQSKWGIHQLALAPAWR
jgi:hypothetical protein